MKQKTLLLLLALLSVSFMSCSDDDDDANWNIVPTEVRNSFTEMYPNASRTEWEDKGGYKVAEFIHNGMEADAWFDATGTWFMTETDLPFNSLPQAVRNAFAASEYSTWRVDDVDMLERRGLEVVYIIEVELQNNEFDLYYSAEGILVKAVPDTNNGYESHLPQQPTPTGIETLINERYPQARIVDIEWEAGRIEVDIIHDQRGKEVVFDTNYQWLYTSWDVRVSSLPQSVANIVNNPQYTGYYIDDADFVETPTGSYYLLELERGNSEINIRVDESGNILI